MVREQTNLAAGISDAPSTARPPLGGEKKTT
jgi:hypothetical protein